NFVRNRRDCVRRCNHVLGIATIEIDAGNFAIDTHCEVSATTLLAHEAVSTMPTDTDALAHSPCSHVVTERIDASSDLMSGHTWILKSRPDSVFDKHVAMTNPARLDFHAHLPGAGLRNVAFYQFPIPICSAYLCCFHARSFKRIH